MACSWCVHDMVDVFLKVGLLRIAAGSMPEAAFDLGSLSVCHKITYDLSCGRIARQRRQFVWEVEVWWPARLESVNHGEVMDDLS